MGVLEFKTKTIYVYDSLHNKPYERAIKLIKRFARLIPHMLKCMNFCGEHKDYKNDVTEFEIKWMVTPQQENKYALTYIFLFNLHATYIFVLFLLNLSIFLHVFAVLISVYSPSSLLRCWWSRKMFTNSNRVMLLFRK